MVFDAICTLAFERRFVLAGGMPDPITRRSAMRQMAGAAALASLASRSTALAAADSANMPGPTTKTSALRQSVCRWCYRDIPLEDLCRAAKEIGLESVELLDPEDWPVVQRHGLTCAMANGVSTIPDGFNRRENHARLVPGFRQRLREAAAAGLPNVICFSGNRRGLDDEAGLENCAIGIKQVVGEAERVGVTLCMELLNSRVNHPDYQCDHTTWGIELVRRVGSERFKLLFDIYHMQIMEGDLIRTIREHHESIAHYHTAGNPGRHEFTRPEDIQEMNYAAIMRAIHETGYTGFIGQEFVPTRDPIDSLREAFELCSLRDR